MKYIDNLIDWGDLLFTQDTQESITQATNLYVMASDLLGNRPEVIGECPIPEPMSFNDIKAEYPAGVPEFLIRLENTKFASLDAGIASTDTPVTDIYWYFCIPENEELTAYWDRVEDRLFKIRHCMNIQGVERQLPLFEPPINPRELIRAAAAGGAGTSIARALESSIPYYRFDYMIERAQGFTANVMQLGSALLSALEKRDAEQLALLNVSQTQVILDMTTKVRELQIAEVGEAGAALDVSLNSAKDRKNFYSELVKKDLSPGELQNIEAMKVALAFNVLASITRTLSAIGYALPNVGSPFAMTYGGEQIGAALNATSGVAEIGSMISSYIAENSLTMSNYKRRKEEWEFQVKMADFDIEQIESQIAGNKIAPRNCSKRIADS